jgi:hypothetical protein
MRLSGQTPSVKSLGRETLSDLIGRINCPQKVPTTVSLTLTPDKRIYLRFKNKLHAAWLIREAKCAFYFDAFCVALEVRCPEPYELLLVEQSHNGSRNGAYFMGKRFAVGDHVTWNSEAGYVSGKIIKVHFKDVNYKGHMRRASKDEPQYEIQSDKTDHIAMHKGAALNKTNG